MCRNLASGLLTAVLALAAQDACAAPPDAASVFEALKTLAGEWRSIDASSATRVTYRVIANGSALLESWSMSPTRESLTVYAMDGTRLLATHYCPQGNAPRLVYERTDAEGAHHFRFLDGSNLGDPEGHHQHAFWVRVGSDGAVIRSETYLRNGAEYDPARDTGAADTFVRTSR